MLRTLVALVIALLLTALALATSERAAVPAQVSDALAADRAPLAAIMAERARISAHLERVEGLLRGADVGSLSAEQRRARSHQLDVLRDYRVAGRFPHNHVLAGERTPVFVDGHGTHCAVGYLLAQSGEMELVARIAATRNLARVPELADVPGLAAWLERNGLTVEEAAAIQPAYGGIYETNDEGYARTTLAFTALSAAASAWNLLAGRTGDTWHAPAVAGLVAGTASIAWGVHGLGSEEEVYAGADRVRRRPDDVLIAANFLAGALAGALGVRTLVLGRRDPVTDGARTESARLELSPLAGPDGAGVRATLRFQ